MYLIHTHIVFNYLQYKTFCSSFFPSSFENAEKTADMTKVRVRLKKTWNWECLEGFRDQTQMTMSVKFKKIGLIRWKKNMAFCICGLLKRMSFIIRSRVNHCKYRQAVYICGFFIRFQNDNFPLKNGHFICEIEIRGQKYRNKSTANNKGNLCYYMQWMMS